MKKVLKFLRGWNGMVLGAGCLVLGAECGALTGTAAFQAAAYWENGLRDLPGIGFPNAVAASCDPPMRLPAVGYFLPLRPRAKPGGRQGNRQ